jgi:cytochrome c oxidase subunit 2
MKFPVFPESASRVAEQTDYLYWALTLLSGFMLLLVFIPILFFLFKYRRGKRADRRPIDLPTLKLEVTWTVIPTLLMMGLFAWGATHYFIIERPPPGAMEINVVGKQWMWKIQHPEGNREINELHLPSGRVVKLTLASQDVIHSFFLPEFRIKQDVVPGRYTTEWLKARRPGTYHLFCSEFCGTQHSGMIGKVIVMEPGDYAEWLTVGQPGSTLAQSGEKLYRDLGCSGCHTGQSVVRAPPLEGIFGKPVPLQGGDVVVADEAYIRDSILFPARQITAGYTNLMPSFQGRVSEEELLELVSYIKSLNKRSNVPGGNR